MASNCWWAVMSRRGAVPTGRPSFETTLDRRLADEEPDDLDAVVVRYKREEGDIGDNDARAHPDSHWVVISRQCVALEVGCKLVANARQVVEQEVRSRRRSLRRPIGWEEFVETFEELRRETYNSIRHLAAGR